VCRSRARVGRVLAAAEARLARPQGWRAAEGRGGGRARGGGGARRQWRRRRLLLLRRRRRRAHGPSLGRSWVGGAAVAAASEAMYRSSSRSSVSSHRLKDGGGGGPRTGRSSGSSSGPVRRSSPPPPSCFSSLRPPARRPRSPSGHRSRWASPSPSTRGRRGSPSPPRGRRASPSPPRGRRVSPSPPRARRGSPSPPRGRRLFPPGPTGFRGSSRGESRADFARDGRGDHSGDSGSRVIPPLAWDALDPPPGPLLPEFPLPPKPLRIPPARGFRLPSNGLGTRSGAWAAGCAPPPPAPMRRGGKVGQGRGNFIQPGYLVLWGELTVPRAPPELSTASLGRVS
jgi:hypothetical protein